MSDLLGQALLLQARQPRRESAQSRLAAQMLAAMNAPANMGGPLDVLNRASAGIFGTLMAQRAEADARAREKQDLGAIIDQDTFQRQQRQEAMQGILGMAGLGGMTPAAPAQGDVGAMTPAVPPPQGDGRTPVPPGVAPGSFPNRPEDRGPTIPNPDFNPNAPEGPSNPRTIANPWHDMRGQLPPASGQVWNPNPGQPLPTRAGETTTRAPAAPLQAAAPAGGSAPNPAALERAAFAAMASGDPQLQPLGQMLMQMARRDTPNLTSVSPGSALVDPRTGRVVAQIPERETWNAPVAEQVGDRTVMAQYSNLGGRRVVEGAGRAPPPEAAPRSPERLRQDVEVAQAGRPTMGDTFGQALGREGAQGLSAMRDQAMDASNGIRTADRIMQLLDAGAITGTGADLRLSAERALATLGIIDGRRVANTEQLLSELANGVLARTGDLRGPLSNADVQFLRDAAAGSITITDATLRRVAQLAQQSGTRTLDRYNNTARALSTTQDVPEVMRQIFQPIPMPERELIPGLNRPPAGAVQGPAPGMIATPPSASAPRQAPPPPPPGFVPIR